MRFFTLFSLFIIVCFSMQTFASETVYQSGVKQVTLLELYTSEGCSSCPPADRWLTGLKDKSQLWREWVPIALHVDYWDYIGWKDRFASREYSQRQRQYAREYREATVYTPGVRANGREWRRWYRGLSTLDTAAVSPGNLSLKLTQNQQFTASFRASDQINPTPSKDRFDSPNVLTIAVLGMGLQSKVKRGENRGKILNHDFVVLALHRYANTTPGQWVGHIPEPNIVAPDYAIAAWLSIGHSITPLQSVGGAIPSGYFTQ